ncbi:MAG TPA: hypothetical protein VM238_02765 [Phycisphaerae bacterium]|nr:hypothetical protein [Phycisphaerae bacterium]
MGLRLVQHGYTKNGQFYGWYSTIEVEIDKKGHVTGAWQSS